MKLLSLSTPVSLLPGGLALLSWLAPVHAEPRTGTSSTGAGRAFGVSAQAGGIKFETTHPAVDSYYQPPLSYGTTRDPDPPRYVHKAGDKGYEWLNDVKWLDLGLDYRFRYEYRDDDIRRPEAGRDEPWLHRTRAYVGIHNLFDPIRFAFEMQDSRRYNSNYPRDTRDVNEFEVIRAYVELYFPDLLGHDDHNTPRPVSVRYGIHNFEFLDRRLIANNQWRNTSNTFQGFQVALGQERNDFSLDLLAVQPRERSLYDFDEVEDQRWLYAVIGHWRKWSKVVTIEPYYLNLHQSGYQSADGPVTEREIQNVGLRLYGKMGESGFDYDTSGNYQFGYTGNQPHRAFGITGEVGYSPHLPWKPRFSAFFGYASGDEDPNDNEDNRFERFFGTGRPWSSNDYIVFENIATPKLRTEITPTKALRIDFGYSWYYLASKTDRFNGANNARDPLGHSNDYIGSEFDIRARYALSERTEVGTGYAYFTPGEFTKKQVRNDDTDFFYLEFSQRFF